MTTGRPSGNGWIAPASVIGGFALLFVIGTLRGPPPPRTDWLAVRIQELQRAAPTNPPRSIVATRYRGEAVYFIARRCCDVASELYTADGRLLCNPDGGFIGMDARCPDFRPPGPDPTVVWSDPRQVD